MDASGEALIGDGIDGELSAEVAEGFVISDGEVKIAGAEGYFGGALVLDLVLEVGEATNEGVEFCLVVFDGGDGSRKGLLVGEVGEGGRLFFEGPSGGGNDDENNDAHGDENQAASECGARGLGGGV